MVRFLFTTVCAWLLTLSVASAQDNEPRVFAGGPAIYGLKNSLYELRLESADLEKRIRRVPSLTVLLILPAEQKPQPAEPMELNEANAEEPQFQYPIDICLPGDTIFTHMHVSKHDHDALKELASDPAFLLGVTARTISSELPPDQQKEPLDQAIARIERLPITKQLEARYRIGQMMADRKPENAKIQRMVSQYRMRTEREIIARLTGEEGRNLSRGELYQFGGAWGLTERQILAIDPKQVKTVEVNERTYNIAWVGDKMLMVADPDPSTVAVDPTGLGLQGIGRFNAAIRPQIIDAPRGEGDM